MWFLRPIILASTLWIATNTPALSQNNDTTNTIDTISTKILDCMEAKAADFSKHWINGDKNRSAEWHILIDIEKYTRLLDFYISAWCANKALEGIPESTIQKIAKEHGDWENIIFPIVCTPATPIVGEWSLWWKAPFLKYWCKNERSGGSFSFDFEYKY